MGDGELGWHAAMQQSVPKDRSHDYPKNPHEVGDT